MKRTLQAVEVVTPEEAAERALPEEVKLSLAEIAEAAKEGLLALATGTGLAVLHEAMEHEKVAEIAGPQRDGADSPGHSYSPALIERQTRERAQTRHPCTGPCSANISLGLHLCAPLGELRRVFGRSPTPIR